MTIYTIGFTQKSAEKFFEALHRSGAKYLLDIRLKNNSQLAGFTKRSDLPYFLKNLVNMEYKDVPILAPVEAILKEYRKTKDWMIYEQKYLELIRQRHPEEHLESLLFEKGVVLLCSEAEPAHCHRRLAAEYLAKFLPINTRTQIMHL